MSGPRCSSCDYEFDECVCADDWKPEDQTKDETATLRAEVERLREENKDLTATLDQVVHERDKAMAEAKALAEAEGE